MDVLHAQDYFAEVYFGLLLSHLGLSQMHEQLTSRIVIQDEVEIIPRFEGCVEGDCVGVQPKVDHDFLLREKSLEGIVVV